MADALTSELLQLSADIVASHLVHNKVAAGDVPDLIRSVYATLCTAGSPPVVEVRAEPAVPIKRSVFAGYIVCREDGKKMKMLKRHLQTAYGMTPDAYRAQWGLPMDYPMVAPDYAARRSVLAKGIGLGRKPAPAAGSPAAPVLCSWCSRYRQAAPISTGSGRPSENRDFRIGSGRYRPEADVYTLPD